MNNNNSKRRQLTTTPLSYLTIIVAVISPLPSPSPVAAVDYPRWEIVSRNNFSSEIQMHPNLLLMVTLPWLGESQSLMKDLAERIAGEKEEYGSPKLMILYKDRERMLADAIGATDGITIIFYHNSLPYKYQGRLRSQNILSSLQYLISHPSEQLPIQPLNTQWDLKTFLQSTDKAVLLLEFCGWTQQLLTSGRKNGTTNDFDAFGDMKSRFPQFYFMDCTLNECSLILRSVAQRESYPHLLLFPAESKVAVSYEGDIVVSDIIKFVIDYGNKTRNLVKEKGTLSSGVERENRMEGSYDDVEALFQWDEHHEVLLEHRIPEEEVRHNREKTRNPMYRAASQVVIGSLLVATEKLVNVHPFDNSVILIVNAHEDTGFQGLIINKHISWDSFKDLEEELEELLKDARLSLGGPLVQEGMPFVALTRENTRNHYPEVLPNIHFLDQLSTIHEIQELVLRDHLVTNYWFFIGYSSWGCDQLFNEIKQGAWNISSPEFEDINWPWR